MPRYRHIIWDWNGTLLDDVAVCVNILNGLLERRLLAPISIKRYRETFDFPVMEFYRHLGVDFSRESYTSVADEYIAGYTAHLHDCRLQEGAATVLDALCAAGVTHSILSAYHQKRLEEAGEHFGVRPGFSRLVGLNDYSAASKLQNGLEWIEQLDYPRRDILLVGDTRHDWEVAEAMGVDCVLLACGHQSPERLAACGTAVLDNPAAVQNRVATQEVL